ncbi:glycoside hydrolase domain-containing protein [Nocardia blacklockiae]|uniref:glycoside hydrolase domain-containing protein n=1 Tax=Nocardia blacklockiae TaxID=480036 RepID=UPI00189593F0|nr:glycoside hydrolase domain-containing protein [Nocardia blacklockiae]MBF6175165.1 DUF1906 domain-containing protein [Nocardia blacklockiae]
MVATPDDPVYPGLDINKWDDRMVWLWQHSNLRFCGFYLAGGPGDDSTSWTSHWFDLCDLGWGRFPLWVSFASNRDHPGAVGRAMANADGARHGRKAAQLAVAARLEKGAVIYLDIEEPSLVKGARDKVGRYVADWMTAVRAAGYRAGAYLSYRDVTPNGLLSADFRSLRPPELFPYAIAGHTRAHFDRDTFTLPPAPPSRWPVPDTDPAWASAAEVVGCQYDWYRKGRTDPAAAQQRAVAQESIDWPDATGKRTKGPARSADWDAAIAFDPTHPRAAVAVAATEDGGVSDRVYLCLARSTGLQTGGRDRTGAFTGPADLNLRPADIGPTPATELDGFDAANAAIVSRRADHQDLFVAGLDGFVRTSWVTPRDKHPKHPWPLNPTAPARKGTPLAAVSRFTDRIDLFYVDRTQHVVQQWWHPTEQRWDRQRRLFAAPLAAGGTNLAALATTPERLDIGWVTFDYTLPPPSGDWAKHWKLALAMWTAGTEWRVTTLDIPGGAAAATGVGLAADTSGTLHCLVQNRARTALVHAVQVESEWVLRAGPAQPAAAWWMTLHLTPVADAVLLVGVTSEGQLAWSTWSANRWSDTTTATAPFSTGRPLALATRGPRIIDIIGVTDDGTFTTRTLELLADGTLAYH